MYSVVLMLALSGNADMLAADGSYGCQGGCCGGNTYLVYPSTPHSSFFDKFFGHAHHGCHGCCGGGYYGGAPLYGAPGVVPGPVGAPLPVPPARPAEPIGAPKDKKSAAVTDPAPAEILVDLPAEARLFVDDQRTLSTTSRRTLVTPALAPGRAYSYTLRIELERDGKTASDTRRVSVTAGETATVSFVTPGPTPAGTAPPATPAKLPRAEE